MSTTDHTQTITPHAEELDHWTEQVREWFETNNRKRIDLKMKADLAAQGARWCPSCRHVLLLEDFQKDAARVDGLRGKCRRCQNGAHAEWREANRAEQIEYFRTYYAEHREEQREYHRELYATSELRRLRQQLSQGYYRAVQAGNPAERVTAEELLAHWSDRGIDPLTCALTGEALTPQTRSLDHCTPIGRGGAHHPSNLIPVSYEANLAKGSRTLLEFLADRAAAQDPEEIPDLVRKAMETSAPVRQKRTVVVQIEEQEGDDA